jgi:uncharacterized protein YdhG (YjbR/CyaY superfamily)
MCAAVIGIFGTLVGAGMGSAGMSAPLSPEYAPAVAGVDDYLAGLNPAQREQFERVRRIVRSMVPDAEETISYGIPTFKHRGKYLVYFAAFKDHMSVYPTVGAVEATEGTKGTFRFSEDDPVPEEVVRAIVAHRLEVIGESETQPSRRS